MSVHRSPLASSTAQGRSQGAMTSSASWPMDGSVPESAASFSRTRGSVNFSRVTSGANGASKQASSPSSSGGVNGFSKQGSKISLSVLLQSQASGRSSAALELNPQTPSTVAETVRSELSPSGPNGRR